MANFARGFQQGQQMAKPFADMMSQYFEEQAAMDAYNQGATGLQNQSIEANTAREQHIDEIASNPRMSDADKSAAIDAMWGLQKQYGPGRAITAEDQRVGGLRSLSDYYAGKRGKMKESMEYANMAQQSEDSAANRTWLTEQRGRTKADWARQDQTRELLSRASDYTPQAEQERLGRLGQIEQMLGSSDPETAEAARVAYQGLATQQGKLGVPEYKGLEQLSRQMLSLDPVQAKALQGQAKTSWLNTASQLVAGGNYKKLADFISEDANYGDGMRYEFLGAGKNGISFAQTDAKGSPVGQPKVFKNDAEIGAFLQSKADPSKMLEYYKTKLTEERMAAEAAANERRHSALMARLGGAGGLRSDKELTIPAFDPRSGDFTNIVANRLVGKDGKVTYTDRAGKPLSEDVLTRGLVGDKVSPFSRQLMDARKGYEKSLASGDPDKVGTWESKIADLQKQNQQWWELEDFRTAEPSERISTLVDTLLAGGQTSMLKQMGAKDDELNAARYVIQARKGKNRPLQIGVGADQELNAFDLNY